MAGTRTAAAARRCTAAIAGGSRGCATVGRGSRGGRRTGGRSAATLEVRGIPARPLELKARRGELFAEGVLATGRTLGQRVIRNFLQDVLGMAAGPAFVGINGHGRIFLENPGL